MRILITGATGFVGKNLVKKMYLQKQHSITLISRDDKKIHKIFNDDIDFIKSNDPQFKEKITRINPEVVIHLASYLSSKNDEDTIKNLLAANIEFGTRLLDSIKDLNVKFFINTGTSTEYFYNDGILKSNSLYAATKTAFRSIIRYYQDISTFKFINVIPYTIYGGKDTQKKAIDYIFDSLDSSEPVPMSPGDQVLDYIHIDDVCDFYSLLVNKNFDLKENEIEFHLGTGKGISLKDLCNLVEKVSGKKANIAWGKLPYREMDKLHAIAPITKCLKLLNWRASISIEDGIKRMINEHTR